MPSTASHFSPISQELLRKSNEWDYRYFLVGEIPSGMINTREMTLRDCSLIYGRRKEKCLTYFASVPHSHKEQCYTASKWGKEGTSNQITTSLGSFVGNNKSFHLVLSSSTYWF